MYSINLLLIKTITCILLSYINDYITKHMFTLTTFNIYYYCVSVSSQLPVTRLVNTGLGLPMRRILPFHQKILRIYLLLYIKSSVYKDLFCLFFNKTNYISIFLFCSSIKSIDLIIYKYILGMYRGFFKIKNLKWQ